MKCLTCDCMSYSQGNGSRSKRWCAYTDEQSLQVLVDPYEGGE